MTANSKNNGLLICGACAVSADPERNDPPSVEKLGVALKKAFTRKQPSQSKGKSYGSTLQNAG